MMSPLAFAWWLVRGALYIILIGFVGYMVVAAVLIVSATFIGQVFHTNAPPGRNTPNGSGSGSDTASIAD